MGTNAEEATQRNRAGLQSQTQNSTRERAVNDFSPPPEEPALCMDDDINDLDWVARTYPGWKPPRKTSRRAELSRRLPRKEQMSGRNSDSEDDMDIEDCMHHVLVSHLSVSDAASDSE